MPVDAAAEAATARAVRRPKAPKSRASASKPLRNHSLPVIVRLARGRWEEYVSPMKKGLLFLVAISFACSGDPGGIPLAQDPYADVPLSGLVRVAGLDGPIDIVRDKFGVPHVYAQSIADATFAEGYAAARDRLPQMNLFRHFASGTISELFGALDRSQIDQDLSFRMH